MISDVELREVDEADLAVFFEDQLDPVAIRMAAWNPRDRGAFMAHWTHILGDGAVTARTVLADGEVAGNVLCWGPDDARDVGYWIGRRFWGSGVATAALGRFLEVVADRPLFAHVAVQNVGSIRVLEKCGFTAVGERTGDDGVRELVYELPEDGSRLRDNGVPRAMP